MNRDDLLRERSDILRHLDYVDRFGGSGNAHLRIRLEAIDRELKASDPAVQRDKLRAVLAPLREYHRRFIQRVAHHAVDLAVAGGLTEAHYRSWDKSQWGSAEARSIGVAGITNEPTAASAYHELGHALDPNADARQHRYEVITGSDGERSSVSPLAECAAWVWAIDHMWRGYWTSSMNERMTQALSSYRSYATPQELEVMTRTVAIGFEKTVPAPDTFEGRLEIVKEIAREQRFQQSANGRRWRRLQELGLA